MSIKIFVYLSETADFAIGLVQNKEKFTEILKILQETKKHNVFYDKNNFLKFSENIEILKEPYLENSISQMRILLGKTAEEIKDNLQSQNNFILWNFDNFSVEYVIFSLLKDLSQKIKNYPNEKYLLVNIGYDFQTKRNFLTIFEDGDYNKELPNNFIKIPFICDFEELEIWLNTYHITNFSLFDKTCFKKTSKIQQGKSVYEELKTGYFWYLDNLHKTHYEVFDKNEIHLGEATLEGILDTNKAKAGRAL